MNQIMTTENLTSKTIAIGSYRGINERNKEAFVEGLPIGLSIGLGYLAVGFSLGIVAKKSGLTVLQGVIASLLTNASAGEFYGFTQMSVGASLVEIALAAIIINARYFLMSCALSQKIDENTSLGHRLLLSFDITDEIFGATIAREGTANPYFTYGTIIGASPFWAAGTGLGIVAGNILPEFLVEAIGVALYGMFIAVIIPEAKKSSKVAIAVFISFLLSTLWDLSPLVDTISAGTKTIILTVGISSAMAFFMPVNMEEQGQAQ